jgi:hypothetical protein
LGATLLGAAEGGKDIGDGWISFWMNK